jgi:hypothetical protein
VLVCQSSTAAMEVLRDPMDIAARLCNQTSREGGMGCAQLLHARSVRCYVGKMQHPHHWVNHVTYRRPIISARAPDFSTITRARVLLVEISGFVNSRTNANCYTDSRLKHLAQQKVRIAEFSRPVYSARERSAQHSWTDRWNVSLHSLVTTQTEQAQSQ